MTTLTDLPATGTQNFNTGVRNVFDEWKAAIEGKAEADHTHGAGGTVLSLCQDETNLGTGATDGEMKITYQDDATNGTAGNRYTWDDGNSKWRICPGNNYTTEPSDSTYRVETGTVITVAGEIYVYDGAAFVSQLPQNHITGLILSQDTDADHDVNITAGECMDSTNARKMVLPAAITKQLDASWAVGDDAGGLDGTEVTIGGGSAGVPNADTLYSVWQIMRSDTGVVDVLLSESMTTPAMPANYDYKRFIGYLWTDSSANIIDFYMSDSAIFFNQASLCVVATGISQTAYTASTDISAYLPTGHYDGVILAAHSNATANTAMGVSLDGTNTFHQVSGVLNPADTDVGAWGGTGEGLFLPLHQTSGVFYGKVAANNVDAHIRAVRLKHR